MNNKSFLARVIAWPEQLTIALTGLLVAGITAAEVWLSNLAGVDITGQFLGIAVIVSTGLSFWLHGLLEKWIPETYHPIVNAVLETIAKWVGGVGIAWGVVRYFF